MRRVPLIIAVLAFAAAIGIFDIIALRHSLYYAHWWLDVPLHITAGIALSLAALWVAYHSGLLRSPPARSDAALLVSLGAVLAIGIFWELAEHALGRVYAESYLIDTLFDIANDAVGAFLGFSYFALRELPHLQ